MRLVKSKFEQYREVGNYITEGDDLVARPKNQAARRRELVLAAKAAIVERGLTGLRAIDVAERAGLSAGSVAYYYPDLDDLVREVHRDAVARFTWQRLGEHPEQLTARERLACLIRSGIPASRGDLDFQVLNELHTHAARDEYHAGLMAELYRLEVELYVSTLEAGLRSDEFAMRMPVATAASNLVALEDAYGLHYLGGTPLEREEIYALIAFCAGVLTGCSLPPIT